MASLRPSPRWISTVDPNPLAGGERATTEIFWSKLLTAIPERRLICAAISLRLGQWTANELTNEQTE